MVSPVPTVPVTLSEPPPVLTTLAPPPRATVSAPAPLVTLCVPLPRVMVLSPSPVEMARLRLLAVKVVEVLSAIRTFSKLVTVTPVLMLTMPPPLMDRVSVSAPPLSVSLA
jgi:hypothetical protein